MNNSYKLYIFSALTNALIDLGRQLVTFIWHAYHLVIICACVCVHMHMCVLVREYGYMHYLSFSPRLPFMLLTSHPFTHPSSHWSLCYSVAKMMTHHFPSTIVPLEISPNACGYFSLQKSYCPVTRLASLQIHDHQLHLCQVLPFFSLFVHYTHSCFLPSQPPLYSDF